MIDNPNQDIEKIRNIIEQIAKGLQALQRQEMLHQDLRPDNIMIDKSGTIKVIDYGSVKVAGLNEVTELHEQQHILGTMQYTAPEYFLGEARTTVSDLFSLGIIAYQLFSGRLPYGTEVAITQTGPGWEDIAEKVGLCSVFLTSACLGMYSLTEEYASKLFEALELSTALQ
jgi:serine/threonine protein kinase